MKIDIRLLKKSYGEKIEFNFCQKAQDFFQEEAFFDDIIIEGVASNIGKAILVKGIAKTQLKDVCARCLKEIVVNIKADFTEEFLLEAQQHEDIYFCRDDIIDLSDLLQETLIMAKPLKNLCDKNCRGLCPKCGENLNDMDCGCNRESIDPRLLVFKKYIQ